MGGRILLGVDRDNRCQRVGFGATDSITIRPASRITTLISTFSLLQRRSGPEEPRQERRSYGVPSRRFVALSMVSTAQKS